MLCFGPCKSMFVGFEDVLGEFGFFRPQEVVFVDIECVKSLLRESSSWQEWGWISRERWERKKWIFGSAPNNPKVLRERGCHRVDFICSFLVCKGKGGWDCVWY